MVFNASRLLGKTVLVTGSSAGIGRATAILFAKAGSNVILLARRAEALEEVKQACIDVHQASKLSHGGQFAAIPFDVSDRVAINGIFDKIPANLRDIDILVNNAGYVVGREHVGDLDESVVEGMFATNVLGLISLTNLFVKDFKSRGKGHIINLGSVAGREPYAGGSIYTATKHAVNAFTASMMRELINTPIRVTEIQPGMVETEFSLVRFKGDAAAAKAVYAGIEPLTGEDIAEEIVWAASRPPHVNIAETLIFPVNQASATVFYRAPS
uniref:Short-chain dehydrogenase/reductase family protein n=1 Tax=Mycena chlorophos TaxID=658473 RepID=A0ABQ0M764_MYCCL|nr:short-chain dehydrogenase/reductase family protein [Mycena chlorophos]